MVSPNITHDERNTPTLSYRKKIYCEKKTNEKTKKNLRDNNFYKYKRKC